MFKGQPQSVAPVQALGRCAATYSYFTSSGLPTLGTECNVLRILCDRRSGFEAWGRERNLTKLYYSACRWIWRSKFQT